MASDRLHDLIHHLIPATKAGKIIWQTTAKEGAFRVALGEGLVRIEYRESSNVYAIYLVSRKGQTIGEIIASLSNYDEYKLLDDLYKSARLSAFNADAVIDSMLKDIEEGRTREIPPDSEKSEISF
jgi:hypothetical protein